MNETNEKTAAAEEQLLWEGAPAEFNAMDRSHKAMLIKRLCIFGGAGILIFLLCLLKKNGSGSLPIVGLVILLFCAYYGASPMLTSRKLKKFKYRLTDQALTAQDGVTVSTVELHSIRKYEFRKDSEGYDCLLIGPDPLKKAPVKWRDMASFSPLFYEKEGTGEKVCDRFVVYGIRDVEKLRSILEKLL